MILLSLTSESVTDWSPCNIFGYKPIVNLECLYKKQCTFYAVLGHQVFRKVATGFAAHIHFQMENNFLLNPDCFLNRCTFTHPILSLELADRVIDVSEVASGYFIHPHKCYALVRLYFV